MTDLLTLHDTERTAPLQIVGADVVQRVVQLDREVQPDTTETITPESVRRQIEKLASFNYQRSVFNTQQYGNTRFEYQAFVTRAYDESRIEEIIEIIDEYNPLVRQPGRSRVVRGTILDNGNRLVVEIEGSSVSCFSGEGQAKKYVTDAGTINTLMFMLGERMAVAEGKHFDRTEDERLVADVDAFSKIATIMPTLAATTKH